MIAEFVEISRRNVQVTLDHKLWGRQAFKCEHLQVIDDDYRKGVVIKGREIFVYKKNIVEETGNMVFDGKLRIIVNKL